MEINKLLLVKVSLVLTKNIENVNFSEDDLLAFENMLHYGGPSRNMCFYHYQSSYGLN